MGSSADTLTLDADMRNVAAARRHVEAAFGARVPPAVVADLVLAVSELVTNAIEHGVTGPVVVSARVAGRDAVVSVRSADDAGRVSPTDRWYPAAPDRPNGRGLGIVHAVADDVTVVRDRGALEITVSKRLQV